MFSIVSRRTPIAAAMNAVANYAAPSSSVLLSSVGVQQKRNQQIKGLVSKPAFASTQTQKSTKVFTDQLVHETLQRWCDNVVATGKTKTEGRDAVAFSNQVLSDNYDYDNGKVLFKPTLTFGPQTFRPTKEGALAYFVGGNPKYPNDNGFKLKPWVKVWYTNLDYILHNDLALVQCNVHFIGGDDSHIFVNKSFVFRMCEDGKQRIMLHHSALPYKPAA